MSNIVFYGLVLYFTRHVISRAAHQPPDKCIPVYHLDISLFLPLNLQEGRSKSEICPQYLIPIRIWSAFV